MKISEFWENPGAYFVFTKICGIWRVINISLIQFSYKCLLLTISCNFHYRARLVPGPYLRGAAGSAGGRRPYALSHVATTGSHRAQNTLLLSEVQRRWYEEIFVIAQFRLHSYSIESGYT